MRRLLLFSALLGASVTFVAPLWADGVVLNGVSPRRLSRGGTNIAHADNGAMLHDNPAAMVNFDGCGFLEVGAIGLASHFDYSDLQNSGGVASDTFTPMGEFAYVQKSCDGVWAYGLGVFSEAGFAENYTMQGPAPFFPVSEKYKSFGALGKILPGVSCRLTDRLSIGGTFGLGVSHAELEGPYFLQGPSALAGTPTLINLHGTGAAPVWSVGLQYALTDTTTIGATYLSSTRVELEGETRVSLPFNLGSTSYDSELQVEWPQSVGIGIRQQLGCWETLSADVIWFGWSDAFDAFQLRLRNPTNGFPAIDETIPLNWHDSVSLRLGYERQLDIGGTLRLGYVYHRNPIPDGTLTPFIQATLQHSVAIGYGWQWGDWTVDAGYMYLFGPTQDVAASQLLGGDFSVSSNDATIHAVFASLQKPF